MGSIGICAKLLSCLGMLMRVRGRIQVTLERVMGVVGWLIFVAVLVVLELGTADIKKP